MGDLVNNVIIIGSGVAGLTAAYVLRKKGIFTTIIEKDCNPGGLSKSFCMGGEWFDIAAHVEFSKDAWVRALLESGVELREYPFIAYNYKKGKWIKNPVQNNLSVLDVDEKVKIITDYVGRKVNNHPHNYHEWLRAAYGEYFSANYPDLYTRKYWTVSPELLETRWVENRMYRPNLEELLTGAFTEETENVHYTNSIRYPYDGGFQAFLPHLLKGLNAQYGKEIIGIDAESKLMLFADGKKEKYDYLINTAPIKDVVRLIDGVTDEVIDAANRLYATRLVLVSILVEGELGKDYPVFYIYDEDIPASRVYSNTKLSHNFKGKSSIQAEVYYSDFKPLKEPLEHVRNKVVSKLAEIGCYREEQIIETDVRYVPYANIIFTPNIYRDRDIVRGFIEGKGIACAGRFGEWDYLWTEQAVLSGKRVAEQLILQMKGGK